ncbi:MULTISPECIES: 6-pyruvoyl trahydropterin synthase family protein [Haloarcula]|uniref:6-carboxy-5,6,7,8-tetrahydropterin synthase n=1 Tax=Haloarcula pellucida TaxID=1427151 RepID=A0A830GS69_9EURY|nr:MULTISPECIES: 6-pyruvoyl tetrahydropterin synthase family protein [Halomicroarcula]MBX0349111.1 6-pyruvoyl tetrahydropterin synthase family protein [Halomicroarcula pellucida]MDS0279296.1 6-pyruvoyl tetrahydropterin synthase family protein [Halomicroarcula sp. S1AR25-4]GGN99074.1 6-carboxy-5,6,7,8-tetrahydropterin synthase [Halomicroarcula pellucida]
MTERISSVEEPVAAAGERELVVGGDRPIRLSAGHRLMHHDGKCSRPHGHNYEVTVRVTGELTDEGWVVDKGDVTGVVEEWDHRFLLERGDPLVEAFETSGDGDALVVLNHPPTAEVMAVVLESRLSDRLPDTVSDVSVSVRETSELCTR